MAKYTGGITQFCDNSCAALALVVSAYELGRITAVTTKEELDVFKVTSLNYVASNPNTSEGSAPHGIVKAASTRYRLAVTVYYDPNGLAVTQIIPLLNTRLRASLNLGFLMSLCRTEGANLRSTRKLDTNPRWNQRLLVLVVGSRSHIGHWIVRRDDGTVFDPGSTSGFASTSAFLAHKGWQEAGVWIRLAAR